jgi:hypothetical protein
MQLQLIRESPRTLMDSFKIALAENDVLKRWELRKGRASSETHYEFNRPNRRMNKPFLNWPVPCVIPNVSKHHFQQELF